MNEKPIVSFLVLTYNRLKFLNNLLWSIFYNCSSVSYEIIVVNNNSTDGTKESLDIYLKNKTFKNLKVIHLSENYGVIARNKGIELASGVFIAQYDDDTEVLSTFQSAIDMLSSEPKLGAVGQNGFLLKEWLNLEGPQPANAYVDCVTGFCWIFRNKEWKYDENFGKFWHEEDDLCFQIKDAGYKIKVCKPIAAHHSARDPNSMDWNLHNKNVEYLINKWKYKELLFEKFKQAINKR